MWFYLIDWLVQCLEENLDINDKVSFLDTPEVIALNTLFIRDGVLINLPSKYLYYL